MTTTGVGRQWWLTQDVLTRAVPRLPTEGFRPAVALARLMWWRCQVHPGATAVGTRVQPLPGIECVASPHTRVVPLFFDARSSARVAESYFR